MFLTKAITSPFPTRSAKEGEGIFLQDSFFLIHFPFKYFHNHCGFYLCLCYVMFSTRQYTVPDPPGLFDGHVWPMYLKHRREMENSGITIGTWRIYILLECYVCDFWSLTFLSISQTTWMVWKQKRTSTTKCMKTSRTTCSTVYR